MAALVAPPGPSAPVPTAAAVPSVDPATVIAAAEQGLAEYLNRPVQEILAALGHPLPSAPPPPPPGAEPPVPPPAGNPLDPGALIKPVTDALGTLGTGMFEAIDPTKMFESIATAVESSGSTVAPAMSQLAGNWEGEGATAAAAKTTEALRNGQQVATQATDIRRSVASATAAVKQAEARLLEIIARFQATVAAIGPSIIFPWGQAALLAAATEAVTRASETIAELQAMLSGEANAVTAAGAPVAVTEAPQAGGDMMSQFFGALTKGAQSGVQSATDMASGLSESAAGAAAPATPVSATAGAPLSKAGGSSAGTSGGAGGGGAGGSGFANTLSARSAPPMPAVSEEVARTTPASTARPAGLGGAMMPPGMMGAPMAGAHGGRPGGDVHTAADFLHTTDNGQEIVGDLGTAAPPVLGETEAPRVQKRAT